jgi:uncharacterized membrane protein
MWNIRLTLNVLIWTLVIGGSLFFLWTDVFVYLTGFRSKSFGTSIFNNQLMVVVHLVGGTTALLCGPFQFWKGFRDKYLKLHRNMGKAYMIGGTMVALSAFRSSLISVCLPCRISLFLTALLMFTCIVVAWYAIRNRHIKQHKQFMIRSYVLMLAFVFVRIDAILPLDFMFGTIEDPTFRRTVNEYFFSFFPLIITEFALTWLPYIRTLRK